MRRGLDGFGYALQQFCDEPREAGVLRDEFLMEEFDGAVDVSGVGMKRGGDGWASVAIGESSGSGEIGSLPVPAMAELVLGEKVESRCRPDV